MNDALEYRILIPCVTRTPVTCGGNPSDVSDLDVRRDSHGRTLMPGTSIAGVLRQAFFDRAEDRSKCLRLNDDDQPASEEPQRSGDAVEKRCECSTCRLFGNWRSEALKKDESDVQMASRVWVCDAVFYTPPSDVQPGFETRVVDGVGISRQRRAAADAKKFDRTEIRAGAWLDIEVRVENPTSQELEQVVAALRQLVHGRVGLGRRTSEGLGRIELRREKHDVKKSKAKDKQANKEDSGLRIDYRDLNQPAHLINAILHCTTPGHTDDGHAWANRKKGNKNLITRVRKLEKQLATPPKRDVPGFNVTLSPTEDSAFLVSDPTEAFKTGFDHAPRGGLEQPELPGSSLRGCLRSAAERILRTIVSDESQWPLVACCITDKSSCSRADDREATCCLACRIFGNTDWASRMVVDVRPLDDSQAETVAFDHVSIDRFTGGARDQRKFNALATRGKRYRASLQFRDFGENAGSVNDGKPLQWMVGLLALALRDLHEGYVNLGSASSRGLGRFQVEGIDWGPFDGELRTCVDQLHKEIESALKQATPTKQEPANA